MRLGLCLALFLMVGLKYATGAVSAPPAPAPIANICAADDGLFVTCAPDMKNSEYTGYDIELFRKAASLLPTPWIEGVDYQFSCIPFPQMIDDLVSNNPNCTAGLGGITISTARREKGMQFTYPTYRTSLAPLVRSSQPNNGFEYLNVYTWEVWLAFFLTIPCFALLVFALEYVAIQGKIRNTDYYPGLKEAAWRSTWTMFFLEPFSVTSDAARSVAWVYGIVGLIFVQIIQGKITATLTVDSVNVPISVPNDLVGKAVETLEPYVSQLKNQYNLQPSVVEFEGRQTAEQWVQKLRSGTLLAVLVDEPLMQQISKTNGCDLRVVEFPNPMVPFDLGVAFAKNAPTSLVEEFTTAVRYMQEDSTLTQLRQAFIETTNAECDRAVGSAEAVGLDYVWGIWVILGAGIGLALCLLAYQMWHRRKKEKGQPNPFLNRSFNEARKEAGLVQYRAGIAFRQKISMFAFQLSNNKRYLKEKKAQERRLMKMELKLSRALSGLEQDSPSSADSDGSTVKKLLTMCDALDGLSKRESQPRTFARMKTNWNAAEEDDRRQNAVVDAMMDDAPLVQSNAAGVMQQSRRKEQTIDDNMYEG